MTTGVPSPQARSTIAETPADFPATVLYDFRLASLGGQLVLWTALGLVFGALVHRAARPAPAVRPLPQQRQPGAGHPVEVRRPAT